MSVVRSTITRTPLLISTAINHYLYGPPLSSWDLKFHLIFKLLQSALDDTSNYTIEQLQILSNRPVPLPAGMTMSESKIDNKYRHEAQVHLDKILKPYEHVLDTEWKDLKDNGIDCEWIQVLDDGWEKRKVRKTILYIHGGAYIVCGRAPYRQLTGKLAKKADARVFAIEYRLAPQNQFPAALQDALAAYLYLLNPPEDAGFDPLNPKDILFAGDSAGGGISMALGLAVRDAGLPSCAGIIGLSPWVDLTHSTPSILNDRCYVTDYVNNIPFRCITSPAVIDYQKKAAALTARIKKQDLGPKIWHDSFDKPEGRFNMYAPNEGLAIPYVSPMLAESLGDLPPLFLVVGNGERLRDETIYLAHRSAEPTKYKGPSFNAGKFEKSPFQNPTNTTLDSYEEMPHVFQFFDHDCTEISYERMAEFIDRVTDTTNKPLPPSSYNSVSSKGINPLNEHQKEVLESKNIGIAPNFSSPVTKVTPRGSIPKIFVFIALLLVIIVLYRNN